jgi:hypothetical protein
MAFPCPSGTTCFSIAEGPQNVSSFVELFFFIPYASFSGRNSDGRINNMSVRLLLIF